MKITLSPKESVLKTVLEAVEYFYQEGSAFTVIFDDGRVRSYLNWPLITLADEVDQLLSGGLSNIFI